MSQEVHTVLPDDLMSEGNVVLVAATAQGPALMATRRRGGLCGCMGMRETGGTTRGRMLCFCHVTVPTAVILPELWELSLWRTVHLLAFCSSQSTLALLSPQFIPLALESV